MKLLKMICFAVSPPVAAGRCLAAGPILAAIEAWSNSPAKVPCSKSDLCSGSIPCSGSLQWVQPLQRVPAIRSPGRKAILVYCMCFQCTRDFRSLVTIASGHIMFQDSSQAGASTANLSRLKPADAFELNGREQISHFVGYSLRFSCTSWYLLRSQLLDFALEFSFLICFASPCIASVRRPASADPCIDFFSTPHMFP